MTSLRGPAVLVAVVTLSQASPPPRFEAIQAELFAAGGTFVNAAADYDADGDVDLFVGFNGTANRLYSNDRGRFRDIAEAAGIGDPRPTRAAAWGDFDADGDPDLLVGFAPGDTSLLRLYANGEIAGGRRFTDVTAQAGLSVSSGAVRQLSWIDVDGDADLDLFVAFRDRPNALYRNDKGTFTDVAASAGLADPRRSVGAVWFDGDMDGDLDLYVGNMDGDANGFFRNSGGTFEDVAERLGLAWGGREPRNAANGTVRPCAADVDNDGRFDLFTANYGPNGLFLNRGDRFEDVSRAWGVALDGRYDACAFSDVDHDGRLDLYVNGTYTGNTQYPDYLFRNTGSAFVEATPANVRALNADHGALWADVDGDGDEDLALTGARPDGMHLLLRNLLPAAAARRSVFLRILDARGRAVVAGAEVRVYAAGTKRLLAARLVDSGSGYNAQNDIPLHVGLGDLGRIDVEVIRVGGGRRIQTWTRNLDPRNRRLAEVRAGGA
jgi:hypothetical protein